MKVLMFGWEFPPHISGGLGTACYGLTRGLLYHGIEVTFVVPKIFDDHTGERFRLLSAGNIGIQTNIQAANFLKEKFTLLGISSPILPYMSPEAFYSHTYAGAYTHGEKQAAIAAERPAFSGVYGSNLMEEISRYAMVAATLASNETHDIIHAHEWHSFPAGLIAKAISGKPLVVHIHATEYDRSGDNINREVYNIEKRGMEEADHVIAVSEYTKQIIISKYSIAPEKITVVHNGIDEKDAGQLSRTHPFREKIISFLGRVTYQKGPEYFIEAAAKVLRKDRNYRFVMAGAGDKLFKMIEKAAGHRLMSHFHFTGFLKGGDVAQMFAMSDVYVMPSVSEPFGISPLEAIQFGVPVIISKQSGVREVLKHAIALDFWDTDAMANAIHALSSYEGLSGLLKRQSSKELENLRWETQAKKIIHLYKNKITT